MEFNNELWKQCIAFHGHECKGLAIGYKASQYAMEKFHVERCFDEEVICVCECDACGVDAIQFVLGCTLGKGNLLFKLRGKSAFNFYHRTGGENIRLVLKKQQANSMSLKEFLQADPKDLFEAKPVTFAIPEKARMFSSQPCNICKEETADYYIRSQNGKQVCPDCFIKYNRFDN